MSTYLAYSYTLLQQFTKIPFPFELNLGTHDEFLENANT